MTDRHPSIDNDGVWLENGPPASPQQIDIAKRSGTNHENRKSDAAQLDDALQSLQNAPKATGD